MQNNGAVGEKVELLFLAFAFASLVRGASNDPTLWQSYCYLYLNTNGVEDLEEIRGEA